MEEAAAAVEAPPPASAAAVAAAADTAADAAGAEPSPGAAASSPRRLLTLLVAKLCTWYVWKTVILGQMLSLCICGTAVISQYLADRFKVNAPMLQSFINYCLLLLVYTTMLIFRTGSDSLWQILKQRWWKYIIVGLADVEANYTIVKAYQYTTLTSVQGVLGLDAAIPHLAFLKELLAHYVLLPYILIKTFFKGFLLFLFGWKNYLELLDCFGIPVLMALSWFLLRARYKLIHFVAVAICLLGVGTMVGADILAGREEGEGSHVVIGDVLVLLAATLYAISNVGEEYIVKNLSRVEFLGMVGLFGTIFSGLQLAILEHKEIMKIQWNWKIALLFIAFALCMFALYSFMPFVIKVTSATSVNLAILTSDLYSLFLGLYLFFYKFSGLYIVSFVIIMVGFTLYCAAPSPTAEPTALPQPAGAGQDNAALKLEENDAESPAVAVQFSREETVELGTN